MLGVTESPLELALVVGLQVWVHPTFAFLPLDGGGDVVDAALVKHEGIAALEC